MRAFLFPGQGAQKVGMGKELAEAYPVAKQTFEEADDALGFSISRLCFEGPEDDLRLTAHSQPAILTMSIAALRAAQEVSEFSPDVVAGHSLGEYSALVCADAMDFADAVRTVHKRGLFMQEAVPEGVGAMAALIGLTPEQVQTICNDAARGEVIAPANFNGGNQVVVAGNAEAVARAIALAEDADATAVPLKVSAPFHCPLMAPAAALLAEVLAEVNFRDPKVPVVCNVTADANQDGSQIAKLLTDQVTGSVLWEASVQKLEAMGVDSAFEFGPGRVLGGLVRRITRTFRVKAVGEPKQVDALKEAS